MNRQTILISMHVYLDESTLELWRKANNLLICNRNADGSLVYDVEKNSHFVADMRRDNLDETELLTEFNTLAGKMIFRKIDSCVSPSEEKEISLFRDGSGNIHFFMCEIDKLDLNSIVIYISSRDVGADEIRETYQEYKTEFGGGEEIVNATEYIELGKENEQLDLFEFAA